MWFNWFQVNFYFIGCKSKSQEIQVVVGKTSWEFVHKCINCGRIESKLSNSFKAMEYSKYLQLFCMTAALKGRHQIEWPQRAGSSSSQLAASWGKCSQKARSIRQKAAGRRRGCCWLFMAAANNAICCGCGCGCCSYLKKSHHLTRHLCGTWRCHC